MQADVNESTQHTPALKPLHLLFPLHGPLSKGSTELALFLSSKSLFYVALSEIPGCPSWVTGNLFVFLICFLHRTYLPLTRDLF